MIGHIRKFRHPATVVRGALRRLRRRRPAGPARQGRSRARFFRALAMASLPTPTPALPGVTAAVAVGERLRAGLAWEWSQIELSPQAWRAALTAGPFDVILIEISGGTSPGWSDGELAGLLEYTHSHRVPVAAWVTGGPGELELVRRWIDHVDHVFISLDDDPDRWRGRYPDVPVGVLGPAAQPRVHSPRFGGANRREMAVGLIVHGSAPDVLSAVAAVPANRVDIWPNGDEARAALEAAGLQNRVAPNAGATILDRALSRYSVVADAGDVDGASWRIVEAGSAQTSVVVEASALSRVPADLCDMVTAAKTPDELQHELAARVWQRELRDREGVRLAREVHARHTFGHRVDEIMAAVGRPVERPGRSVSAVVPTNREHELDNVFANLARQAQVSISGVELVLVLHGLDMRRPELEARATSAGIEQLTVIEADSSLTLGACMNLGVEAASGNYIAKMDDDNFYGAHYLTDLIAAFDYTDAGIVGKWAHYTWLRSTGAVVLRCGYAEHRPERLVQGGTIVMKRDVARELPFGDLPRAVDSDLLNRAHAAGVMTYSADRFNFVSIRGADRHAHTWTITDAALMNRAGSLVFYGDPRAHVEV